MVTSADAGTAKESAESSNKQLSLREDTLKRELEFKNKELERYKKLYEKGIIAAQEWETKNLDFLQVEKNFRSLIASISQMKSSINDLSRNKKATKISERKDNVSL